MQHQPSSWYLPWSVSLQKMLPLQFQHSGVTVATPSMDAYAPATYASAILGNGCALNCQVLPSQHHHHQNSQNTAAATMQASNALNSYPQSILHPSTSGQALSIGAFNCPGVGPTLHQGGASHVTHAPVLNGSGHGNVHQSHMQTAHLQSQHVQALHSAMFSPLSLGPFLTSAANALGSLTSQRRFAPCGSPVHHQSSTATLAADTIQQLSCLTTPFSSQVQHHYIQQNKQQHQQQQQQKLWADMNVNESMVLRNSVQSNDLSADKVLSMPIGKILTPFDSEKLKLQPSEKRKAEDSELVKDLKKAKLETKALKAKRPGFTDERYHETSYYIENGLRKVYPYYFTFTTFTKGRWVGEQILEVFAREFRAHPAEEYKRCINAGTLTVNYEQVTIDYKLKHNDLLANIVHRHEVPVTSQSITIVHMDEDIVVVNKPASIPVHPCGRYRHNTVVFILAKEYNLKNLRTIHRLDRLTSGLLLFGRSPKKARQMEHQIRHRQVQKEYICRVEGEFPEGIIECKEPIEVVSYKIGVCKVSTKGKDCTTTFQKIAHNGKTSVVLCKPLTGRMHQIRVHLQYLGFPVVNDPLYNHRVFGPQKGRGGDIGGKSDEQLVRDLINIHNAENWLGIDGDSQISLFTTIPSDDKPKILSSTAVHKGDILLNDDTLEVVSEETSPCSESRQPGVLTVNENETPNESFSLEYKKNGPESQKTEKVLIDNRDFIGKNFCLSSSIKIESTVATQTGHEFPDTTFNEEKMTSDKYCYECKVRYRDPKPKDLVMYLHAWKYKGPDWEYETVLPYWASTEWTEPESN